MCIPQRYYPQICSRSSLLGCLSGCTASDSGRNHSWHAGLSIFYPAEQVEKKDKYKLKNKDKFILDYLNPFSWFKSIKLVRGHKTQLMIMHWVSPVMFPIFYFLSLFLMKKVKILNKGIKPFLTIAFFLIFFKSFKSLSEWTIK